jgi:SAM-dependent methyltransferase
MGVTSVPTPRGGKHPGEIEPAVVWHDIECGCYRADLGLWRELAATTGGPVLDVGAGTGRVALELARRGVTVIALDNDPVLLRECARRARGLPVQVVLGDARALTLAAPPVPLCLVPMQTIQLLDEAGRAAFLRAARARVAPGGLLACALTAELQPFDEADHILPAPDELRLGSVTYSSQPTAVRELEDRVVLERRREIDIGADRRVERDVTELFRVPPAALEQAAEASGWRAEPRRAIAATVEHVGATVVMLRA